MDRSTSGARLRVHVLIDSLNWGGAETLLAEYALGAQLRGIEVSVAYLSDRRGAEGRLRELGIEPELLGVRGLLSRANRRRVEQHLSAIQPDVLHTHLGYADFYGGFAARALEIPAVSTLHTMEEISGLRHWAQERLMAWSRRRGAYRVIAVSEALREHYLHTGWDTPDRVVTVPNGVRDGSEPGAGLRVRNELGIDPGDFVVGMLSVLRSGKGHDIAARAIASLLPRHPRLRFLVLGDGPGREEVEASLRPLADRAILAGHRDDVFACLDAMDVLVHPSSADALPTALIEAMAANVPVIASRVGGIPEILDGGEDAGLAGVMIDAPPHPGQLADAIVRLLSDPEQRTRLAKIGRTRFEAEFSIDKWFDRLIPIYEAAIAELGPPNVATGAVHEGAHVELGSRR